MPVTVTINDPDGNAVPLGEVNNPKVSLELCSGHGRCQAQALQLEFTQRELGQSNDDSADDVIYSLAVGRGRGEAIETSGTVEFLGSRQRDLLGTLTLERASILAYNESDTGDAVACSFVIRAAKWTYTPADGTVITFDILSNVGGRQ